MATGNREVCFRFCTGDFKAGNVTLRIYDPVADLIEIQCEQAKRHGMWTASVKLPTKDQHYNYVVEPKLYFKTVRKYFSTIAYAETKLRNLRSNIDICRDVFEPPPGIEQSTSISFYPGLIHSHLQSLVDSLKTINELKQRLLELENLSRAFNDHFFQDLTLTSHLRIWLEQSFVSNATSPHRLVLLSTLYGKLAKELDWQLRYMSNIPAHVYKMILGAVENIERNELTNWTMDSLRITALQALEATRRNHWLYAAASFPHLFVLNQVMDLSLTMKEGNIDLHVLEHKLFPRILEGYKDDEASTILYNLVKSAKFKTAKQKTQLTELVDKFSKTSKPITSGDTSDKKSPHADQKAFTTEVYTAGAWSATSKLKADETNANLLEIEELDTNFPPVPLPRTQDATSASVESKEGGEQAAKKSEPDTTKSAGAKRGDNKPSTPPSSTKSADTKRGANKPSTPPSSVRHGDAADKADLKSSDKTKSAETKRGKNKPSTPPSSVRHGDTAATAETTADKADLLTSDKTRLGDRKEENTKSVTHEAVAGTTSDKTDLPSSNKESVLFQLLIREENITSAKLILRNQANGRRWEFVMNLSYANPSAFKKHMWRMAKVKLSLPVEEEYTYQYVINKWVSYVVTSSSYDIHDYTVRHVSPPKVMYDVFMDNTNSIRYEILSQGRVVYADMMLQKVSNETLKDILMQIEEIGFPGDTRRKEYITEVMDWIQDMVLPRGYLKSQLSQPQMKFLAVLLGKLIQAGVDIDKRCVRNDCMTLLIQSLQTATRDEFPTFVGKDLVCVCPWLVSALKYRWLYIWMYYHRLFDVNSLVNMKKYISPQWSMKTWESDRQVLKEVIDSLKNDQVLIEQLLVCCLNEVCDTRVLKEILLMCRTEIFGKEESAITTKAVNQLNKQLKDNWKTKFQRLYEIWQDMVSANLTEMADHARIYLVSYLTDQTWLTKDKDDIEKSILCKDLYSSSADLKEIIQNMLKQSAYYFDIYEYFLNIVQNPDIFCANPKTIEELLELGMQSLAPLCRTRNKKNNAIRVIYKILAMTKVCDHLSCLERLQGSVDKLAYNVVKEVPIDCLLSSLDPKKGCDLQPQELLIVAEHIIRRLSEDKQNATQSKIHVRQLKGSDGNLRVSSAPMRDIILAMIGIQEQPICLDSIPPDGKSSPKFESSIMKIIQNGEFWIMVFKATGQFSDKIRQHTNSKAVIESVALFSTMMFAGNITVNFVRQSLQKHKETVLELFEVALPENTNERKQLQVTIKRVFETEKVLRKKLNDLDHFYKCLEHLVNTIQVSDAKDIATKLRHLQQAEGQGSVTLKQSMEDDWWGILSPLLTFADELREKSNSTIFLNICRSIMEGTCENISQSNSDIEMPNDGEASNKETTGIQQEDNSDAEEAEDDEENDLETILTPGRQALQDVWNKEPIGAVALAHLMDEICIPTFTFHCNILFCAQLDIPLRVVENMMDGISDMDRLEFELKQIKAIFGKSVPKIAVKALKNLVKLPDLTQRSCQLNSMFATFEVDEEEDDDIQHAIKRLADLQVKKSLTLQQLHDALQTVSVIEKDFEADDWDIIEQLASSQELVNFLGPLVDEDLRNLIDAVEERSEQHVSESTVSDLIDVKRYMEALLKVQSPHQAQNLIDAIKQNQQLANEVKGLPAKIDSCVNNVHSLRDLYNNVANRGEMTKEVINNALQQGFYSFRLDDKTETCNVVLTYKRGTSDQISEASYGLNQLNDFRSRALLIVNTKKHVNDARTQDDLTDHTGLPVPNFEEFISCINAANDIKDLCTWLRGSGHFSFRHFEEKVHSLEELDGLKRGLESKFDNWRAILKEAREKYYFLNFFHSKQLWKLDQFFQGKCEFSEELALLFRFVNTGVTLDDDFRDAYESPPDKKDLKARLFHLGMALANIFNDKPPVSRQIPGQTQSVKSTLDSKVRKGVVFVAELEEDSTKSIPVLLRLYSNTTGVLPEPSQIVFCHQGTVWEEIALLLQRCTGASSHFQNDTLFTLANVELLSTETQFQLVTEVKRIQENESNFLLAMICRGGSYHHIIDQFSPNYTHCLHGFSDAEMSSCLHTGWPEVEVVTSAQPGLGKTEYIRNTASKLDLGVRTMPVSGPIIKEDLVEQLQAQNGMDYDMLHIDVAPVSHPKLFDTFLFEVVVVGMSVSGTHMCLLPNTKIVLEVANTQKDKLRNALTICSSFTRTHLEWLGFHDFIVSKDVNSPVQVVCQYLKALNSATLDKSDITLSGQSSVSPLSSAECRILLDKLYGSSNGLSFTTVSTFLEIFAQELRRMSASLYFTTRSLKDMLGNDSNDVRSKFVQALLEVSKDFTARSVKSQSLETQSEKGSAAALLDYRSGSDVSASQMVARMQGMVKWADSNHLLVVFHRQDSQTISTLYRVLDKVPANISKLFKTQMKRNLQDYNDMSQEQLHAILEKVCRSTRTPFQKEKLQALATNYALTPDNLLKMVLIHMRIKARIPVIIMGETGCGKTTLITYLARVCEVAFEILNLHAGISEQDILNFVTSLQVQAEKNLKQEVWGFLDEINTCDHLGILNEVICHHSIRGVSLPSNLIFIAACNPYCLREGSIVSAGLEGKHRRDEMSKLVYRVHPLPETMMDFVWDYGSLDKKDEEAYIRRMLEAKDNTFVDLVVMSQDFMRDVEQTSYCVSLRDVNRCQYLANWFVGMLKKKKVAHVEGDKLYINKLETRSMILALAHCYHSRLTKAVDRQMYRQNIATILGKAKPNWDVKECDIECMIRKEQLDILERMQLPEGIAKNEALRENVFVILISILNRIPVFVVGKPGCSKSLSMQLIRSNLRGPDSKDPYFKSLPPVYAVSYQGSESSTSEGIIKVFDKAKNYKKHNPDVMPVVLLDEIGLAEVSSFNPLKVLHSQLEPTIGGFPPVAVVGISNWALDAAKMNRAIHLSRPEPTIEDLADTAKSIRDDSAQKKSRTVVHHIVSDDKLRYLAEAYSDYQVDQLHTNFHGLRDYYSLVKYVAIKSSEQLHGDSGQIIETGILRNFGGLKLEMWRIMNTFTTKIGVLQQPDSRPGTLKLIQENMNDKHARHLMLITSGDSALNILEQTLEGREHVTIFGSRFENDISEEYNYTTLSEIILCMERGVTLVLRDLENIYGSLYDMLNQNYTIVGKKRNCRVALGPYSNPMCQVHQNFRCIVLVDEQKVDYQNPPFLNRFEKQTLRFSDILTDDQVETIGCLRRWMDDICCVEGFQFSEEGMFLGLHIDTLPSLVYHRSQDSDLPCDITPSDLAQKCQNDLMKVACPDAVLRASKSKLAKQNRAEVERFQQSYFDLPLHDGLRPLFENQLDCLQRNMLQELSVDAESHKEDISSRCTRTVIYTHSSIHTNIEKCLEGLISVQVEKLSKFKSERHFALQMRNFWFEADAEMLVLQCITSHDAAHMLLAKSRIDQYRNEYLNVVDTSSVLKHACIIVHIDRGESDEVEMFPWQFNFLSGWEQFTLDTLEPNNPSLEDLLLGSVSEQLAGLVDVTAIIREQLLWCFSCIKYENQTRSVNSAIELATDIANSNDFVVCLKMQILNFIRESERKKDATLVVESYGGWQADVATDIDLLYRCSTLGGAMMEHIKQCVREPLARSVILLERLCAWSGSPCSPDVDDDTIEFWQACFHDPAVFNINSRGIPEPRGPESCLVDCNFIELKYPFFKMFHEQIESNREWLVHQGNSSGSYDQHDRKVSLCEQLTDIINHVPLIQYEGYLEKHIQDYLDDLYNTFAVEYAPNMPCGIRVGVMKWLVSQVQDIFSEITETTVTQWLSCHYVVIWSHAELLAAQLQLLSIYKEVTTREPMELLHKIQRVLDGIPDHSLKDEASLEEERDTVIEKPAAEYDEDKEDNSSLMAKNFAKDEVEQDSSADDDTNVVTTADVDSDADTDSNDNTGSVADSNSASEAIGETDTGTDIGIEQSHVTNQGIGYANESNIEDASDTTSRNDEGEPINTEKLPSDQIEELGYLCDEPAEVILVTKICKDVLPNKQVLDASKGLDDWQRKASSVLLLAGRVSADSTILHFLRLCRDFVTMLSHDFSITEDQLATLSNLGKQADDPLASESIFEFITSTVETLKGEVEVKSRVAKLDNFLTTYFGLCLEANLDTPLLPQIIETLCTDTGELRPGSRPVLLDIIRNDIEGEEPDENEIPVCERLISTGELDEDAFPNLTLIDEILTGEDVDSDLSAACCDIVEDVAFRHFTCAKMASVTSDDNPIWKTASDAVRLISNQDHIQSPLQFVTAAAFIRAFMKSTAELILASDSKQFKIDGKYFVLAKNLNGLLKLEEGARCENSLSIPLIFILKCLRENQSLCDLRKLCVELTDPITNLSKIEWQERMFASRIGYCPMSYVDFHSDALDAISAWQVKQDKNAIGDFINTARSSPVHRLALLAAASNTFYFIQTTDGLTDVDKQQTQWLFEQTSGFSNVYRQFLSRILGLSDFTGILRLSESSSQESLEIASVVIHLVSIIVSHAGNETTPDFMSLVDQSTPISEMLLPCSGELSSVLMTSRTEKLAFHTCLCGLRTVNRTDQELNSICLVCERPLKGKTSYYQATYRESSRSEQKGYNLTESRENMTSTDSVPGLSPVSYRVLDTLLHSCFLAGLCSGFVTQEQMASIVLLPDTASTTEPSASDLQDQAAACDDILQEEVPDTDDATTDRNVEEYLTNRLNSNWHLLREISQSKHDWVSLLLHRIVRACTVEILTQVCPRSVDDRIRMENAFSQIIEREAKNIPECQMQHKHDCMKAEGIEVDCLESNLDELGSVQTHEQDDLGEFDDVQNLKLRRLFRKKNKASLRNLRSRFANICQTSDNSYPFLQLCLSRLDTIQYIQYLPDLLKWNTLVVGRLSHIIKRDEAKRTKVGDFLSDERYHPDPSDAAMATAKLAFSAFQKAWNDVRDGWYILTGSKPTFGTMTAANNITQCVVDKNDENCHLRQIIGTLQEVQNTFLMDTLTIVTYGYCPALNFLVKNEGTAGLQTLPLHIAGSAIIQFEWSDNLLVFHDVGTEYGQGLVINYKYTIIERELARILVLNKAILTEGTAFSQFAYADELFHACSIILSEIGTTILQKKLPKELKNTIEREQSRRQTFAKDMLDHLEVILVLLKKTGGDPGSSLDEYIKRWATQLPGYFPENLLPEPKDGIRLQHIVNLYETLEDLLVGAVVESLHDDFRKKLPERSEDVLAQKLKPLSIEKLEECAQMIRRFIFRFLRSDTKPNTHANLRDSVVRSTVGTMDWAIFTDLLPEDLEISHVVKILDFIDKQAEQRKDVHRKKDMKQTRPSTRASTRAAGNKPARRRRGGMGGVS